jgi:hypothetical protein
MTHLFEERNLLTTFHTHFALATASNMPPQMSGFHDSDRPAAPEVPTFSHASMGLPPTSKTFFRDRLIAELLGFIHLRNQFPLPSAHPVKLHLLPAPIICSTYPTGFSDLPHHTDLSELSPDHWQPHPLPGQLLPPLSLQS